MEIIKKKLSCLMQSYYLLGFSKPFLGNSSWRKALKPPISLSRPTCWEFPRRQSTPAHCQGARAGFPWTCKCLGLFWQKENCLEVLIVISLICCSLYNLTSMVFSNEGETPDLPRHSFLPDFEGNKVLFLSRFITDVCLQIAQSSRSMSLDHCYKPTGPRSHHPSRLCRANSAWPLWVLDDWWSALWSNAPRAGALDMTRGTGAARGALERWSGCFWGRLRSSGVRLPRLRFVGTLVMGFRGGGVGGGY